MVYLKHDTYTILFRNPQYAKMIDIHQKTSLKYLHCIKDYWRKGWLSEYHVYIYMKWVLYNLGFTKLFLYVLLLQGSHSDWNEKFKEFSRSFQGIFFKSQGVFLTQRNMTNDSDSITHDCTDTEKCYFLL